MVLRGEHFIGLTIAVSLHAGLAAALTLSTPPTQQEAKLDLGFEMVELSPLESPVTPSTPVRKETLPTPVSEPPPKPAAVAQVAPPEPIVEALPTATPAPTVPAVPALIQDPMPERVSTAEPDPAHEPIQEPVHEPAPAERRPETPSVLTDTSDALTAEQAAELPLLLASIDDEYIPPLSHNRYLHNPKPRYPRAAKKRGMEGMVMINVRVSREGHPVETLIHTSSGYGVLDRAALKAVRNWRFEAARRGTTRVEGEVLVPIHFELKNS